MAVTFFPFNSIVVDGVPDRLANAENLAAYLAGFFGNGVVMQEDTALKVEAYSGMKVQIRAGMGNINGKTIIADAAEIITLDAASASLARIDRVVFRLDEANRIMEFDVLKGTPAASPTAPALTQGSDVYEMCLAEIRVPAGATSITASYITDKRLDANVCGLSQLPKHTHALTDLGLGHMGAAASAKCSATSLSLSAAAITKLTLNSWVTRTDEKFEFSDGGIKCPYDGVIMISGSVYLPVASSGSSGCYIFRGTDELAAQYMMGSGGSVSSGNVIVPVSAGDVIYLKARCSVAGNMDPSVVTTNLNVAYI